MLQKEKFVTIEVGRLLLIRNDTILGNAIHLKQKETHELRTLSLGYDKSFRIVLWNLESGNETKQPCCGLYQKSK